MKQIAILSVLALSSVASFAQTAAASDQSDTPSLALSAATREARQACGTGYYVKDKPDVISAAVVPFVQNGLAEYVATVVVQCEDLKH